MDTKEILNRVQSGALSPDEALAMLKAQPFEDLGYAKIDHHRAVRQGAGEVIYGAGKTDEQILTIAKTFYERGQETILITRMRKEAAALLSGALPLRYDELSRVGIVGNLPEPAGGTVVVASGGTSDMPVSEEAALTAEALGNRVVRLYDVGVSGLHRLLSHMEEIMSANVIVVDQAFLPFAANSGQ